MTKSNEQKTPIIKLSITKMAIKNSLSLNFIVLFTEIMQSGVINVVKRINKIEIPSIPNLNLIKLLVK